MNRGREGFAQSVWFCMGREGGSNAHAYAVSYACRDFGNPSKKAMGRHKKIHASGGFLISRPDNLDDESDEEEIEHPMYEVELDRLPIIENIFQYHESPWE